MKTVVICSAVIITAVVSMIAWERSTWTRERDAQCKAVEPLVTARATRQQILDAIGQAAEFELTDWSRIEEQFGGTATKMTDIKQRLRERGRLMVYSQSNSIMFIYLDSDGRALHASCFLQ